MGRGRKEISPVIREFVPLKEGQNCLHLVQALYSPEATFLRLTHLQWTSSRLKHYEVICAVIQNYSLKLNSMDKLTLKQILKQKNRFRFGGIIDKFLA